MFLLLLSKMFSIDNLVTTRHKIKLLYCALIVRAYAKTKNGGLKYKVTQKAVSALTNTVNKIMIFVVSLKVSQIFS